MKIVYMGTPAFACPALEALHQSRHDIIAVVTGQDKQIGRGRKVIATEVAKYNILVNSVGSGVM